MIHLRGLFGTWYLSWARFRSCYNHLLSHINISTPIEQSLEKVPCNDVFFEWILHDCRDSWNGVKVASIVASFPIFSPDRFVRTTSDSTFTSNFFLGILDCCCPLLFSVAFTLKVTMASLTCPIELIEEVNSMSWFHDRRVSGIPSSLRVNLKETSFLLFNRLNWRCRTHSKPRKSKENCSKTSWVLIGMDTRLVIWIESPDILFEMKTTWPKIKPR